MPTSIMQVSPSVGNIKIALFCVYVPWFSSRFQGYFRPCIARNGVLWSLRNYCLTHGLNNPLQVVLLLRVSGTELCSSEF